MTAPNESFEILIVDDEPSLLDLLSRVSKKVFSEANITGCMSPQAALDHLSNGKKNLPNLILLDIDLKQSVNGLMLIPVLLEQLQRKVPIVILSSSNANQDIEQAYRSGAAAYTRKPDSLQEWKSYVDMLKRYWYQLNRLPFRDFSNN
ncbi:response regulator [Tellurirhabdus bombi]|uniref:response regulator n=1 Tax=Tellurirhabdus bombi TaxID=2907205 RepID=UPI001F3F35C8|nr:response regulator [Tellurirhabdus bombi]